MVANSEPHHVVSLRGPEVASVGRRFWTSVAAFILALLATVVIVSFVSAVNDNSRIDRLRAHGLSVIVTVTDCVGNIGGSGSNAAGYTCRGAYRLNGVRYSEVIGSKTTFSTSGSQVRCVADPSRRTTIELASAVARSSSSSTVYIVPSLLALLFVALGSEFLRRLLPSRRRTR
jgi:hypothetical protein